MRVRGFSLIEMLVTLAIMGIFMVTMSSYISSVSSQQRIMMQKEEAIVIDNNLTNLFTTTTLHCSGNIKTADISFHSGSPPATVNLACAPPPLGPGGCPLTALYYYTTGPLGTPIIGPLDIPMGPQPDGSGVNVASVILQNFTNPGPDQYTADVYINYGGTSPAPPSAKIATVSLSATTVGGIDTLQTCSQGSCAAGYYLEAGPNGEDSFCIQQTVNPQNAFYLGQRTCVMKGYHLCTQTEWMTACFRDSPDGVHDCGPKLRLGCDGGGDTSEWVGNLDHMADGGTNSFAANIMGGNDGSLPGALKNNCVGYANMDNAYTGAAPKYYRCCYRP